MRAGLAVHALRARPSRPTRGCSPPCAGEDLARAVTDPAIAAGLREANAAVEAAVRRLATRLYRRASRATVERTLCAVVDLPLGAIRRHLVAGMLLPPGLRAQLQAAIRAALLS